MLELNIVVVADVTGVDVAVLVAVEVMLEVLVDVTVVVTDSVSVVVTVVVVVAHSSEPCKAAVITLFNNVAS